MSPIYEYVCPNGHRHERLRSYDQRENPAVCPFCEEAADPIISSPHVLPDGVYSYAPPIGTMDAFDRKMAKIDRMKEHKKDTGKVKLVDEV